MKEILEYGELRSALASLADDEYREFSMKGIPSERPFIGVRIPLVREVVKRVPDEKIAEFLKVEPVAIEEVLARGMLICRLPYEEIVGPRDDCVVGRGLIRRLVLLTIGARVIFFARECVGR